MTDKASVAWFERMRESGRTLPDEYVFHKPFEAIDAALWLFLTAQHEQDEQAPSFKRYRITTGSARYSLSLPTLDKQTVEFATISVRLADERKTYIRITLRPVAATISVEQKEALKGFCKVELYTFAWWLETEGKRIDALAAIQPIFPPVDEGGVPTISLVEMPETIRMVIQKPPGRPPGSNNEWARQEVKKGRDRREVFKEYLARAEVDPNDNETVAAYQERFRKALDRRTRQKTKRT